MSITLGDVKTYLRDTSLLDAVDAKSTRQAVSIINRCLELINQQHDWRHFQGTSRINVKPTCSGLLTATNDSVSLTIADTGAIVSNPTGQHITINGTTTLYTISAYSSPTMTLSTPYQGSGNSSLSFQIYYDTYILPSGTRNVLGIFDDRQLGRIDYVSNEAMMSDLREIGPQTTYPWEWTDVSHEVSGNRSIRLYPSPNASGTLDFFRFRQAQDPSADTDLVDWDREKDYVLWTALDYLGAKAVWRGKENAMDVLKFFKAEFDEAVIRAKSQDLPFLNFDDNGGDNLGLYRYSRTDRTRTS